MIVLSNLMGETNCEQLNERTKNLHKADVRVDLVGKRKSMKSNLPVERNVSENFAAFRDILDSSGGHYYSFE